MNDKKIPQRIVWVDWAKTILIALVCVGHFAPPEIQQKIIWGFHMPAFFFISGYLYKQHDAWRTLVSFVIPVLFYSSITFCVHIIRDVIENGYWNYHLDFEHPWYRFWGQFFVRLRSNPYGDISIMGMWFVIGLIVCRMLCGDIKKFSFILRYCYASLFVFLLWLTIEPVIWDYFPLKDLKLYYGVYAMPFFLFGYIFKSRNIKIARIHSYIIMLAAFFYCLITLKIPRINMLDYQCGPTFILFFFSSMCGSVVLFWICTKLPKIGIVEVFSVGTLFILLLHMQLDYFIRPLFHRLGITPITTYIGASLLPWLELAIEFLLFYYPIRWLNTHCPLLLGKMPRRI